jgi:hypothetical protein
MWWGGAAVALEAPAVSSFYGARDVVVVVAGAATAVTWCQQRWPEFWTVATTAHHEIIFSFNSKMFVVRQLCRMTLV